MSFMIPLRSFLLRIGEVRGWRRLLMAFGFGALTAMSFAPLRLLPMLVVGLSGLALLLEGSIGRERPLRSAFWTGAAFGMAYFSASMAWLANAFLVQADAFAWLIPIILPSFFFGLGLFFALAAQAHVWARRRWEMPGMALVIPLVLALGATEWLRGHILTGLPWNLFAQAVASHELLLQPLAILGPYGYGLLLIALALAPAAAALHPDGAKPIGLASAAIIMVILSFGALRLGALPHEVRTDAKVVIVQPSISQRDKLDSQKRVEGLRRSIAMTSEAATAIAGDHTIYALWPENNYPFLARIPDLSEVLEAQLPMRTWLVTGSIRETEEGGFANTLHLFSPPEEKAQIQKTYDKHRLVPFGETLPFYGVLQAVGLESLSPVGGGGFEAGTGPARLNSGPAPFAPLICYEDVFPGKLYPRGERPDWLVVVTNDAWFGDAAGPLQHLDIARMRAVETGLPLARSANTGISAIIDAEGRLLQTLPLYQPGTITTGLPVARPPTLYARLGDLIFLAMLAFIAVMVITALTQGKIVTVNQGEQREGPTRGKETGSG